METIKPMYEHLNWANQRILETLQNSDNKQIIGLFSHLLQAEQVWFTRIQGVDSSHLPIWEEISLEACAQLVNQNDTNFKEFLLNNNHGRLDDQISYKNSKGQVFTNSLREILTHVALHGHYHRGQINQRLREVQLEPVNVDYITFKR